MKFTEIQLLDAIQLNGRSGMRQFVRTYGDGAVASVEFDEGMIVRVTDLNGAVTIIPWTQVKFGCPVKEEVKRAVQK